MDSLSRLRMLINQMGASPEAVANILNRLTSHQNPEEMAEWIVKMEEVAAWGVCYSCRQSIHGNYDDNCSTQECARHKPVEGYCEFAGITRCEHSQHH